MNRISIVALVLALCGTPLARAQDAATEQRLNELSGKIEALLAGQESMRKEIETLSREIENIREQSTRPNANYASQESLSRLAKTVEEIDRKRLEDYDKISDKLAKLGKTLTAPLPVSSKKSAPARDENGGKEKSSAPESGFEYTVQKGDTLSVIVQACREKGVKVTTDQILKANPGMKPERLKVGQKIFIPGPAQ